MSSACFGKTIESIRRRGMLRFVTTQAQTETFIQQVTFKNFKNFSKNLVAVCFWASSVIWNKPTPVDATVLDLSKLSFYKFHYDEMLPRYGADRFKVVYKNTDCLLYRIKTANLYEKVSFFKHLVDLSDYPEDHFLHDKTNKKVPLTMADELDGEVLNEVFCLRTKFCSSDYLCGNKQIARGVHKSVKKTWHHSIFKNCLHSNSVLRKKMMQLRSVGHRIVVNAVNRVALSCFDGKSYILDDTLSSLA